MGEETSYTQYLADNNIFLYSLKKVEYSTGIKLTLECYPREKHYLYYFEHQYDPAFLKQLNQKEVARRIKADIDRAVRGGK